MIVAMFKWQQHLNLVLIAYRIIYFSDDSADIIIIISDWMEDDI